MALHEPFGTRRETQRLKPMVLIVDDEYGPRESIAFSLSAEFDTRTAGRATDALRLLVEQRFDLVLLDIRMPEMDGIRTLEEIRKIDGEISVILLTGYGTLATAQQAIVGGANQYLRKPPDIQELILAVRRHVDGTMSRRRQKEMTTQALELNAALKREIAEKEPHIWQARAAAELVHDLANPLTVLIGYAAVLAEEANATRISTAERMEKIRSSAATVQRAAEYCQHLAENWRNTSKHVANAERVEVAALVREVRDVIFFGSESVVVADGPKCWVRGSAFELARVFQNLIKNALEAQSSEVAVLIKTESGRVLISLNDNGHGMDLETANRALRGGFTTKASGTGLGLSICRHIIGAHGGELALRSAVGQGTTMSIDLPSAT
jgi:signal transduction histidine kinase